MNKAQKEILDQIKKDLEGGALPWDKPWDGGFFLPRNLLTQKNYRGSNTFGLWVRAAVKGYHSSQWLTFKQAASLGGSIRKGEKATKVLFYSKIDKETETGEDESFVCARAYSVFNLDQTSGLESLQDKKFDLERKDTKENLNRIVAETGAVVEHRGHRAAYIPSEDKIMMPESGLFKTSEGYYQTLFHELSHWTGHKSRLDREQKVKFASESYAFEELIAETSAAFLCGEVGMPYTTQHASYIQSWLKAIKEDDRIFFKAASLAQKAADFVLKKKFEKKQKATLNQKSA